MEGTWDLVAGLLFLEGDEVRIDLLGDVAE